MRGLDGTRRVPTAPDPKLSSDEVSELWQEHTDATRLGIVLCVWGGTLYVPFTLVVGKMLQRSRNDDRLLSSAQTLLGTFGTVFFTLNFLILAVVAFRADRPGEVTQGLHDLGLIMTFSPVAPFTFQHFVIGLAIMQDETPRPVFPRWAGYVNFRVGLLLVPACLIPFFDDGPLAWNGVFSFWIPVAVFVAWSFVMFWLMRRSLLGGRDDAREPAAAHA